MAFPEVAFPSKQLSEISQKLYDLENHETFLQYGPSEGHPEFLTALGKRLSSVVNVYDSDTDDLMVVSGSTQGMDLTVKAFCNEGDIVICKRKHSQELLIVFVLMVQNPCNSDER
jgi:2-aminoadipate transaminase